MAGASAVLKAVPCQGHSTGVGHVAFAGSPKDADRAEDLLRRLAPHVLGVLIRRYGHFDACEDAVQEALLAADVQWPQEGVPGNPQAWLTTVASRRLIDQWRSDEARRPARTTLSMTCSRGRRPTPSSR
jgi:predicted RNA polymerase sigma factor